MKTIKVNVKDTILEPIEKVFDAVVNPEKITKYFASKASGVLIDEQKIEWNFEDVGLKLEVNVLKVIKNKKISFEWKASGKLATVNIELKAENMRQTNIEITESSFEMSEKEIKKALGQTQGWTDFICSMKAYLYADLNLRKGRTKASK